MERKRVIMKRAWGLGVLTLFSAGSVANATMSFSLGGLGGTGVTADLDFTYQSLSATAARLTVQIENTSSALVGGFITGLAFNVPTIAGATFTSFGGDIDDAGMQQTTQLGSPNEAGWYTRFDYAGIKTPNGAGDFDVGILNHSSPNSFINGGVGQDPRILIGETTSLVIDIVGTGLNSQTNSFFESAFVNELSTDGTAGAFNFGLRFQGVSTGGGSDLASTTQAVPAPPAALLAVMGLSAIGLWNRRHRRA